MAKKTTKIKKEVLPSRISFKRTIRPRKLDSGFKTITTEGGIFPVEILMAIAAGDSKINGLHPEDYHLVPGERLNEKITEAWSKLKTCWTIFKRKKDELSPDDYGTSLTRQVWLIPLLRLLDYGIPEILRESPVIKEKSYPISHCVKEPIALHLVSFKQNLDARDLENRAGARISPHSLVQEFLNQSEKHLWGFVSNGLKFRILRDNASFVRAAFVEFDLEAMMESDSYGDFYLFYLLTHQSRVEKRRNELEFEIEEDDQDSGAEKSTETFIDTDCWLEEWHNTAKNDGVRALDTLRSGVQQTISKLGAGFLAHRDNAELLQKLRSGALNRQDYYRQILRLVYRMIFLLIAEDRNLLFTSKTSPEIRELYRDSYSLSRIRSLARRNRGSRHNDLWIQLNKTFHWLSSGQSLLGIPAFGSMLFRDEFTADLNQCKLTNADLLAAVRTLTFTTMNDVFQPINYRNIGTEELGSVYESLLEMHPEIQGKHFNLSVTVGNERKTSGSFYTPPTLVESLLETALDPVLEESLQKVKTTAEKENALLNLKVCDTACGSGHFLIGAAHRLGKRLAQLRSGEEEPAPSVLQQSIRDVIAHCVYGVDINPMAVELCKVSLWIESMEPGKALMFLDHRIRCGNSLLGATRELVEVGIPDEAFKPVEGDDKTYCSDFKKRNKEELHGQEQFDFDASEISFQSVLALDKQVRSFDILPSETANDYEAKEQAWIRYCGSIDYRTEKLRADLWCAAFVWKKTNEFDFPITQKILNRAKREDQVFLLPWMRKELNRLLEQYQFFHWYLEFADVFTNEGKSGFDVVIGNPPWERVKLQEKEWFSQRDPEIANAKNKDLRGKMIKRLKEEYPEMFADFICDLRHAECKSNFIRLSTRYPLCGRGDVNTYTIFAELNRQLISPTGRVGCIVQSGIATDDTTKFFFQDLMKSRSLANLYDFENRKKLFPAVNSRMKFSLLTMSGSDRPVEAGADLAFFNLTISDLTEEGHQFRLSPSDIAMINPNTRTCPIFRSVKDAELTKAIYRRVPVLIKEIEVTDDAATRKSKTAKMKKSEVNPWGIKFSTLFHMSNDSNLFRIREQMEEQGYRLEGNHFVKPGAEEYWPLYEGKMVSSYDHRAADVIRSATAVARQAQPRAITLEEHFDENRLAIPMYWVSHSDFLRKLLPNWNMPVIIGFSIVTSPTNMRTFIPSLFPVSGSGNSLQLIYCQVEVQLYTYFYGLLNSYVFDYSARQKVGGVNLNFYIVKQLPVLKCDTYNDKSIIDFILPRILELTYTSNDMRSFAESLGYTGDPFRWDEERRFLLRCELDALYFGLYLGFGDWSEAKEYEETPEQLAELKKFFPAPLDALDYIMGTFPIVKRKDLADESRMRIMRELCPESEGEEGTLGDTYPSHAVIRKMYQEMTAALQTGTKYQTHLNPPPADDSVRHGSTPQGPSSSEK
ncbi:MAG: N-6 DNA methylase [Thermoguttaceae bacterium]|nr:N-6 DNA methylase [Thermoguttaceae bacterium]